MLALVDLYPSQSVPNTWKICSLNCKDCNELRNEKDGSGTMLEIKVHTPSYKKILHFRIEFKSFGLNQVKGFQYLLVCEHQQPICYRGLRDGLVLVVDVHSQ